MRIRLFNGLGKTTIIIFIFFAALFMLSPIILAILNSFKTNGEIYTNILTLPEEWQWTNYIDVFKKQTMYEVCLIHYYW